MDAWRKSQETLGVIVVEARLRRADGVYRWWLMRGVTQLDSAGRCVKWIVTYTDIDDLKLAESRVATSHQAVRHSERRFSDLLRAVQLLSVMLDVDGRITYCNDYLLKLTGWQRDEVIGHNWFVHFLQEDEEGAAATVKRFARLTEQSVQSWQRENQIVTRAGERRTVRWSYSVLRSAAGEAIGSASIGEDITERKRAQEMLRELNANLEDRVQARTAQLSQAREEAVQANNAKSAFLAMISHEIRTPMNGVIGMIDVLQQTSLNGEQVEMLDLVHESANSLLSIIEDVLDFSKIEAGKLIISSDSIDPGEVVERACSLLAPMANKLGVHLTVFIDPAIPAAALGDEGRFRQIVINLVGNAIKFCSGGDVMGRVSVRLLRVDPAMESASGEQRDEITLDLIVADNGVGMDEASQSQLFTPFSQADSSSTRRFGGTGLGLAICSTLAALMRGRISVCSAVGDGSTFSVRLPLKITSKPILPPTPGIQVERMDCWIVGGEQPLAADLACTLRHSGWRVTSMPDVAAAAVAELDSESSLWLVLPDQVGEALRALRDRPNSGTGARTTFVILEHGGRRKPRRKAANVWGVDSNALSRNALLEALLQAVQSDRSILLERDQHPIESVPPILPPLQAQSDALRVLVAEDNETNRAVIVHQLRLLGLVAEVCSDGREALDRWRSGDFGLLLTDLHMPVMDGYELASVIRSEEGSERRLPIIALTANGLGAEQSRCLTSGMDAYLTKPVRLRKLRAALSPWLKPPPRIVYPHSPVLGKTKAPVDLAILAGFMGDDPAVTEEIIVAFRQSADRSRIDFELAMESRGLPAAADAAHRLKSGARLIGANRLGDLCAEIETAAQARGVNEVQRLAPQFYAECRAVLDFLASR